MFGKLEELKRQTEESNERLKNLVVTENSEDNLIHISMNGHREVVEFKINNDVSSMDKSDLEDIIYVTLNRVITKVNKANEEEVMSSAKSLFPGF